MIGSEGPPCPLCIDLRIVLFEDCSAFTRVAACTLALSPIRDTLIEGFSHFVTSMTAPIASSWSGCRMGFSPTGKRRLCTAHTRSDPRHCSRNIAKCRSFTLLLIAYVVLLLGTLMRGI
jgi:hypothetical protein